jgi:two-component system, response regulator YesN
VRSLTSVSGFELGNPAHAFLLTTAGQDDRFRSPRLLPRELLDGRVRKILETIETGKKIAIRDLALEFNLSASYLQRLFKQETGVAMGEWLSEKRLQRAAHLLGNSYMSVKEIAHAVGYEHVSSFIRAFERRFGQAPVCYRKLSERAKCE